jgi:hypothetical protein
VPFTPIPNTCKVELLGVNNDNLQPIVNVLHAQCSAAPTLAELANVGHAVWSAWATSLQTSFSTAYSFQGVVVTDLNSATGPQVKDFSGAFTGTASVTSPPQVCFIEKLTTALRGRQYRGRVFLSTLDGNQLFTGPGTWTTTIQSHIDGGFSAIQTNLAALTPASTLVVASRKHGSSQPVTAHAGELKSGTQRRRNGR